LFFLKIGSILASADTYCGVSSRRACRYPTLVDLATINDAIAIDTTLGRSVLRNMYRVHDFRLPGATVATVGIFPIILACPREHEIITGCAHHSG
jgi:hypothetical protein